MRRIVRPSVFLGLIWGLVRAAAGAATLMSPDGRLWYECEGRGPPVVLVAGGPGAAAAGFRPWFSRLAAAGFTVIYFDPIGRGRSDRLPDPTGYTVEHDVADLERLRQALGVERWRVLGHSYGSIPALAYARLYPDRVQRLVLSSAELDAGQHQRMIDRANRDLAAHAPDRWAALMSLRAQGLLSADPAYQRLYTTDALGWADPGMAARVSVQPAGGEPGQDFAMAVYVAMIGPDPEWRVNGSLAGYDPTPGLDRVRAPVLMVNGAADGLTPPGFAREIAARLPPGRAAFAIIAGAGHRPWIEQTPAYFARVVPFLR